MKISEGNPRNNAYVNVLGVNEVYYGVVQVENRELGLTLTVSNLFANLKHAFT